MLGLAPHAAALRKVKVRSAEADVLRVRQQFERALGSVEWMPPGLPPGAILLVRRLAPEPREGPLERASFGERVSIALRGQATRARRPWLHADAADAPAVLFADEAELVACLAHDWLRGLFAQHWWWRSVLLDADPRQWLRGEVLPRTERLVPAIALLAARGEAAAFIARLEPAECEHAVAAVMRSHGVPQPSLRGMPEPSESTEDRVKAGAGRERKAERAARGEALRRLLKEVPELRHASRVRSQRRLIALALALERAPTWARSEAMALALDALDDRAIDEGIDEISPVVRSAARGMPAATPAPEAERAVPRVSSIAKSPPEDELRMNTANPVPAVSEPARVVAAPAADATPGESIAAHERVEAPEPAPLPAFPDLALVQGEVVPSAAPVDEAPAVDRPVEVVLAAHDESRHTPVDPAPRIATQFGGLFYLLNVALAMELYGDFTAPLARGLALSPWDWLAMVGRAWFGEELVDDPLWAVLAGLAGREPDEEPGRDFEPPSAGWFAAHLVELHERIALAVGETEGDLPTRVCRHAAHVEITAGTVHVHLELFSLPLPIRIAGLDRDPGWIPAAGRDVRFHFS